MLSLVIPARSLSQPADAATAYEHTPRIRFRTMAWATTVTLGLAVRAGKSRPKCTRTPEALHHAVEMPTASSPTSHILQNTFTEWGQSEQAAPCIAISAQAACKATSHAGAWHQQRRSGARHELL